MPENNFIEQSDDKDAGAVDSLRIGARVQAAKREITARAVLQEMLSTKIELLKNEKTAMGKHETGNWIKWINKALDTLDDE